MTRAEFDKLFLTNTDDTGRFKVYSSRTGITYYVEAFSEGQRTNHGDINPATKAVEGSYGLKHPGAVKRAESLIIPENGFERVLDLEKGVSPHGTIADIDNLRYEQGFRPGGVIPIEDGLPGVYA